MADSKELFCRNKRDMDAALKITKADIFYKMIAYARAEFTHRCPTAEQSTGANNFINILMNLPEESIEAPEWIDSGLHHDLSVPARDFAKNQSTKK